MKVNLQKITADEIINFDTSKLDEADLQAQIAEIEAAILNGQALLAKKAKAERGSKMTVVRDLLVELGDLSAADLKALGLTKYVSGSDPVKKKSEGVKKVSPKHLVPTDEVQSDGVKGSVYTTGTVSKKIKEWCASPAGIKWRDDPKNTTRFPPYPGEKYEGKANAWTPASRKESWDKEGSQGAPKKSA